MTNIKAGDYVYTPRFCTVQISQIFASEKEARSCGYREPTRDDVYQSLALRLIRAVELYKPGARSLKGDIFSQLKYELLTCKSSKARYGFCAVPILLLLIQCLV